MYGTVGLFSDFAAALPDGVAVQAVEYPNDISLSYAELLELVRSSVPASEPYLIVAESFSTPLAIQFAATHSRNLIGLVLSAGFATSPVRGVLRWLTPFLAPLLAYLPVNELAARLMTLSSTAPEPVLRRVGAAIASVKPRVLMDRVQAVETCDVREDLRRVGVPVLCMQARYDQMVNAACLEEMRQVKPDIEVVVLDSSHMLLQQVPNDAAQIVVDFVRRL
jgi:pimeloyl-ACP methyl ester carboxylesterase